MFSERGNFPTLFLLLKKKKLAGGVAHGPHMDVRQRTRLSKIQKKFKKWVLLEKVAVMKDINTWRVINASFFTYVQEFIS